MLVALNMSAEERTLRLDAPEVGPARPARLRLGSRPGAAAEISGRDLRLAPFEAVVLELPAR